MKTLLTLLAVFVSVLGGAGWWLVTGAGKTLDAEEYTFVTVEHGRADRDRRRRRASCKREVFPVGTELAGKVMEICADFNQVVEEGDVLLRLDDRAARQRLTPDRHQRGAGARGPEAGGGVAGHGGESVCARTVAAGGSAAAGRSRFGREPIAQRTRWRSRRPACAFRKRRKRTDKRNWLWT